MGMLLDSSGHRSTYISQGEGSKKVLICEVPYSKSPTVKLCNDLLQNTLYILYTYLHLRAKTLVWRNCKLDGWCPRETSAHLWQWSGRPRDVTCGFWAAVWWL